MDCICGYDFDHETEAERRRSRHQRNVNSAAANSSAGGSRSHHKNRKEEVVRPQTRPIYRIPYKHLLRYKCKKATLKPFWSIWDQFWPKLCHNESFYVYYNLFLLFLVGKFISFLKRVTNETWQFRGNDKCEVCVPWDLPKLTTLFEWGSDKKRSVW